MEKISKLKIVTTREENGKNKTVTRTYQNIRPEAEKNALVKIGTAILTLIEEESVSINRIDESKLQ